MTRSFIYTRFVPHFLCECIAQLDGGSRQVSSRKGEFKVASECPSDYQSTALCHASQRSVKRQGNMRGGVKGSSIFKLS